MTATFGLWRKCGSIWRRESTIRPCPISVKFPRYEWQSQQVSGIPYQMAHGCLQYCKKTQCIKQKYQFGYSNVTVHIPFCEGFLKPTAMFIKTTESKSSRHLLLHKTSVQGGMPPPRPVKIVLKMAAERSSLYFMFLAPPPVRGSWIGYWGARLQTWTCEIWWEVGIINTRPYSMKGVRSCDKELGIKAVSLTCPKSCWLHLILLSS